jgi:transposase-like protein
VVLQQKLFIFTLGGRQVEGEREVLGIVVEGGEDGSVFEVFSTC